MSLISKPMVYLFFEKPVMLRDRTRLKEFIVTLFAKEKKELSSLNYVFCSDKRLLSINREYLNHDYYTDIITFDLSVKKSVVEGEIYISIDRVKENALSSKESINRELHRVIFHGALHLCGYKDKTKVEQIEMRKREDQALADYFFI